VNRQSREWANERARKRPVQGAFAFMQGTGGESPGVFTLEQVDAGVLGAAVIRWCGQGYAMSLSLSGDGGAFGVHLLVNGEKRSKWFSDVRELEDWLTTVPGPVEQPAQ